jgi:hypothetical protein
MRSYNNTSLYSTLAGHSDITVVSHLRGYLVNHLPPLPDPILATLSPEFKPSVAHFHDLEVFLNLWLALYLDYSRFSHLDSAPPGSSSRTTLHPTLIPDFTSKSGVLPSSVIVNMDYLTDAESYNQSNVACIMPYQFFLQGGRPSTQDIEKPIQIDRSTQGVETSSQSKKSSIQANNNTTRTSPKASSTQEGGSDKRHTGGSGERLQSFPEYLAAGTIDKDAPEFAHALDILNQESGGQFGTALSKLRDALVESKINRTKDATKVVQRKSSIDFLLGDKSQKETLDPSIRTSSVENVSTTEIAEAADQKTAGNTSAASKRKPHNITGKVRISSSAAAANRDDPRLAKSGIGQRVAREHLRRRLEIA